MHVNTHTQTDKHTLSRSLSLSLSLSRARALSLRLSQGGVPSHNNYTTARANLRHKFLEVTMTRDPIVTHLQSKYTRALIENVYDSASHRVANVLLMCC
jgi:hypothetical protein